MPTLRAAYTKSPPTTLQWVTESPLPTGIRTEAYVIQLDAAGGTTPRIFTLYEGALPDGLDLDPSGLLSGIPTVADTFNCTLRVTDALDAHANRAFAITIEEQHDAQIHGYNVDFFDLSESEALVSVQPEWDGILPANAGEYLLNDLGVDLRAINGRKFYSADTYDLGGGTHGITITADRGVGDPVTAWQGSKTGAALGIYTRVAGDSPTPETLELEHVL